MNVHARRLSLCLGLLAAGCHVPPAASPADPLTAGMERQSRLFGNFKLPERVGAVENVGLQLPAVSPDGTQILYLRLDAPAVSPMTLLGSADPADTPAEGTLAVWLRSLEGTAAGRRLSSQRWAHSPVWSPSGQAVAYVVNETPGSRIIHRDLAGGRETPLGVPGAVNCLPRFDGDDNSVLFCSGPGASGPFRVFRQVVGEGPAADLTPEGQHCLLPVMSAAAGQVVCARAEGNSLHWVSASLAGMTDLVGPVGESEGASPLSIWAGVTEPVSPDRASYLFYEADGGRIAVYDVAGKRLARHRSGSVAACWLGSDTIALATSDGLFAVNAFTGVNLPLMSGAWIPARFVPGSRTLVVFGKGPASSRLSVYRIAFEPPDKEKP